MGFVAFQDVALDCSVQLGASEKLVQREKPLELVRTLCVRVEVREQCESTESKG